VFSYALHPISVGVVFSHYICFLPWLLSRYLVEFLNSVVFIVLDQRQVGIKKKISVVIDCSKSGDVHYK